MNKCELREFAGLVRREEQLNNRLNILSMQHHKLEAALDTDLLRIRDLETEVASRNEQLEFARKLLNNEHAERDEAIKKIDGVEWDRDTYRRELEKALAKVAELQALTDRMDRAFNLNDPQWNTVVADDEVDEDPEQCRCGERRGVRVCFDCVHKLSAHDAGECVGCFGVVGNPHWQQEAPAPEATPWWPKRVEWEFEGLELDATFNLDGTVDECCQAADAYEISGPHGGHAKYLSAHYGQPFVEAYERVMGQKP